MSINGVGQGASVPANHGQQIKAAKQQGESIKPQKSNPSPKTEPERAHGVIRLLQEGHFKGVADVRLRINFADELNALSQSSLRAAAGGDVSALLDAVDSEVASLLASDEFDDAFVEAVQGAQSTFQSSVNDRVAAFGDTSDPVTSELLSGVQAAFDGFVSALTEIFTPGDAGQGEPLSGNVEAVAPPDLESVSLSAEFRSFIDKLTAAFGSALVGFGESLQNASEILPPLTETNGNGAAYEKFLAILNRLNGTTEDPTAPPSSDLDTVV